MLETYTTLATASHRGGPVLRALIANALLPGLVFFLIFQIFGFEDCGPHRMRCGGREWGGQRVGKGGRGGNVVQLVE